MAPLIVRSRIEKERRQVGAAFGVTRWRAPSHWTALSSMDFKGYNLASIPIYCRIDGTSQRVIFVVVTQEQSEACCDFDFIEGQLRVRESTLYSDCPTCGLLLAYGLYRLGFDDDGIWRDLGVTFTAHEKLELRLSLPREFWPKTWLKEEGETIL